jgi:hypothetical protein
MMPEDTAVPITPVVIETTDVTTVVSVIWKSLRLKLEDVMLPSEEATAELPTAGEVLNRVVLKM